MIRIGTHKMGTPRMRAMTCSSCRSGAPSSTRQLIRTQANAAPPIPSGPAWKLKSYDVDQAVGKALQFFEANESGRMTRNNRARWRGNCYMNDGGRVDLVGGWHDAGGTQMQSRTCMQLRSMQQNVSSCTLSLALSLLCGAARRSIRPHFTIDRATSRSQSLERVGRAALSFRL